MMTDYIGLGALNEALAKLEKDGCRRVFVVASENGWKRLRPEERPLFGKAEVELFSDFTENPDFQDILKGAARYRAFKPDLIIAVGGGSPIDVAKVIKVLENTREPYDPKDPSTLVSSGDGPPLVAVATTSGSGSEATIYAVFYVGEKKQTVTNQNVRPTIAVVDPELTYSLSPMQTAACGFDALSQAIEAFWGAPTTPEAQELAASAMEYILPNLYNAVHTPDPDNRYKMAYGSYLAGQALSISRSTLPHALSYFLTQRYGLKHGHGVALTLPYFFYLNVDPGLEPNPPATRAGNRKNMTELYGMLGQANADDAFAFWRNLMKNVGLAPTLAQVGVNTPEKVTELVDTMDPNKVTSHPVRVPREYLVDFILTHP